MSDYGYRVVLFEDGEFAETGGRFWDERDAEELAEKMSRETGGDYRVEEFEHR